MTASSPSLSPLEARLRGSVQSRFWAELFRNTGQFPLAILILEFLLEGPGYLAKPDMYILIPAAVFQAAILARWEDSERPRRFWGNLIAPAIYTLGETLFEGLVFFQAPHHLGYWAFSVCIGLLQTLRPRLPGLLKDLILLLEDVLRAEILFFTYVVFEINTNPQQTISAPIFFSDPTHGYIALATLMLGFSIGLANLTAHHYLGLLQDTARTLQRYSEWLLGRDLLGRAITDPQSLALARRERTLLFMDIRDFTRWSEDRPPEAVVNLLDRYYAAAEQVINRHRAIKLKFTADEVMAVFVHPEDAVQAAGELRRRVAEELAPHRLGAGIGVHTGAVIEGLLGSGEFKFYDVIGDTANTASRIETAAASGEALISAAALEHLASPPALGPVRYLELKGKSHPVAVYPLEA